MPEARATAADETARADRPAETPTVARTTVGELLAPGVYHALHKFCGHRWRLAPSDPLPGHSLDCPLCAFGGAGVVLDFGSQVELPL